MGSFAERNKITNSLSKCLKVKAYRRFKFWSFAVELLQVLGGGALVVYKALGQSEWSRDPTSTNHRSPVPGRGCTGRAWAWRPRLAGGRTSWSRGRSPCWGTTPRSSPSCRLGLLGPSWSDYARCSWSYIARVPKHISVFKIASVEKILKI